MNSAGDSAAEGGLPRLWVIESPHAGDNTQLRALARALGWPWEAKRLSYRTGEGVLRLLALPTLAGVDLGRSSALAAPWPDAVLASGRGAEAVCFWLKRRNPKLRMIFVGTPWAAYRRFDLVIATPQYRLPRLSNILALPLPVHDVTAERLAAEAARWQANAAHLPRPLTTVLVGGSSGPYLFTPEAAARLGREASALAAAEGGALLLTTSARTGAAAADALERALSVPYHLHRWRADAPDNPFHAMLGLASRIVVTADSVSMMAEACAAGVPVRIFDIEEGRYAMRAEERPGEEGQGAAAALAPLSWRGRTLDATLFRLMVNHAPSRFARDLRVVHRQLLAGGQLRWLDDPAPDSPPPPPLGGIAAAVARIRGLFGL